MEEHGEESEGELLKNCSQIWLVELFVCIKFLYQSNMQNELQIIYISLSPDFFI